MTTDANDPRVEAAMEVWMKWESDDDYDSVGMISRLIAAADAARPVVSDEEVLDILENSRTYTDALTALHAAGFVVVRR